MRIIISPAKQMRVDTDTFTCRELPVFWDRVVLCQDLAQIKMRKISL